MAANTTRNQIFISHATPGDNEYAVWLSSRLSLAGYAVWCDQEKLLGGEDFWKDIERAIRNKALKVITVISERALDDKQELTDGMAKEIALSTIVKKELDDEEFIIPIRLDKTSYSKFPVDIIRLNTIDSSENWAAALEKLLKVLERDAVPKLDSEHSSGLKDWRKVHQNLGRSIGTEEETLVTNRLKILQLPTKIYLYKSKLKLSQSEVRVLASDCPLPCFEHQGLLGSFAQYEEVQAAVTEKRPLKCVEVVDTTNFLTDGYSMIYQIRKYDAHRKISSLVRQAWDAQMASVGLNQYAMANGINAWWFPEGLISDGKLEFTDFNGKSRKRKVHGVKGSRRDPSDPEKKITRFYWYLGFSAKPLIGSNELALMPRVIVSEDNKEPIQNKKRHNAARKRVVATWFNDKWRCLIMGYCSWLAKGGEFIELSVSNDSAIILSNTPSALTLSVSIFADPVTHSLDDSAAEEDERFETADKLDDPALRMNDFDGEDEDA